MNHKTTVQMVIGFLGATASELIIVLGLIVLLDKHPTDVQWTGLIGLASTVVGALAALLVSTHSSPPEPPQAPMPVDDPPIEPT